MSLDETDTVLTALALLAFAGVIVYRVTTPDDRKQFVEEVLQPAAARMDAVMFAAAPYRAALRARTPWLILTPVVCALHVLVFVAVVAGRGPISDPVTLIDWGANYGPRTTNGEWWRLATSTFVQPGPGHLLLILIGYSQISELLERLVGPYLVGLVFVTASVLASLVRLHDDPLSVHAGAAAGVLSLYGLFAAVALWGQLRRTGLTIPRPIYQSLIPAFVTFDLYCLFTGQLTTRASLTALVAGFAAGLAFSRHAGERTTTRREMFMAKAAAVCAVTAAAWPVQSVVDVRPELAKLVTYEDRQNSVFRATVARYTTRQIPLDRQVVARLIDHTILPQVRAARSRAEALEDALPAHHSLVVSAREYLRLREQSWQLWADGFRQRITTPALAAATADKLREAERVEQASFRALQPLRALTN